MGKIDSEVSLRVAVVGLDKELVELVALAPFLECLGVIDAENVGRVLGLPWLGTDSDWATLKEKYPGIKVVIGVDVPTLREKLAVYYGIDSIVGIRANDTKISNFASVHETAVVQSGVSIHADAEVGYCCKINHDSAIHHDCTVGDYSTLSPGSRLLGNVKLREAVFVGAGAIVLPHISVGRGATIGAGAVVTADVKAGQVVIGCPAKSIELRKGK